VTRVKYKKIYKQIQQKKSTKKFKKLKKTWNWQVALTLTLSGQN